MTEYYANWPFDQQDTSDEAEKKPIDHIKALEKQVRLYRQALRFYRDQLNEAEDEAGILSYALDTFTERHPEYAEEIKELIQYSKELNEFMESPQEDDEE